MSTIQYLTQIEFGAGVLRLLPEALQALGVRRPLLIGDRGLLAAGLVDRICATLPAGMKLQRYLDTPANPTEAAVEAAAALYRDADCDGIVAVPTTAGTGSEVGRGALLCLRDGRKLVVVSPYLLPRRAICDPELTLSLPPALTAGTGMDALTHCVETFLSPRFNPPADAIALDGAARAWRWIERAVAHPGDIQARTEMMIAGIHGGLAFQKGLGAVHALAHPLGALTEPLLHHGTVNAVLLPAVLRFNAAHVGDKFARLAAAFGLPAAVDLPAAVSALCDRIGMPPSLRAMGVPPDAYDAVVAGALADHSLPTNPRPLDASALRTLFHEAMG